MAPQTAAGVALNSFMGGNDKNTDEEVTITLLNVDYSIYIPVKTPNLFQKLRGEKPIFEKKDILKNISGNVSPGKMTALMGPSGAGKSSLLDVISGHKNSGIITGDILFNSQPRSKDVKRVCGYVEQSDILLATLTVREILMFTARLRLPSSSSPQFLQARVNEIIDELSLTHCADSRIGDYSVRGISGGEAKRCSIAIELVTDPRVLFLDEPTTGLDSTTAFDLMKVVRGLTNRGRTVLCTIHQPSQDIYSLFDQLILLVSGEVVFNGAAQSAVPYFMKMGFVRPKKMNEPEFVIAVTDRSNQNRVGGIEGPEVDANYFVEQYIQSEMSKNRLYSALGKREITSSPLNHKPISADSKTQFTNSVWHNFKVLSSRTFKQKTRDPGFYFSRFGKTLFNVFLTSTVFAGQGTDSDSVYNIFSVLNFTIMTCAFSALTLMGGLIVDRKFFTRERTAGSYQVSAYFFSSWFAEIPWTILQSLLFAIVYFSVGLTPTVSALLIYLLICFLLSDMSTGLVLTFSSISKDFQLASTFVMPVVLLAFLFAGFYVRKPQIPVWWSWAYYVSFLNYPLNALSINEFASRHDWTRSSCVPPGSQNCTQVPWSSDDILLFWGTGSAGAIDSVWGNILVLVGFWIFWRIMPYFGLRYVSHTIR